jgi:secreted Zn-dependent insulinase-like peptidase
MCDNDKIFFADNSGISYQGEFVSVMDKNGTLGKMLYKDIIDHEKKVIKENVVFVLIHGEYSKEEVKTYRKQVYKELEELKRQIKSNPDIVLKLNKLTNRFVVVTEQNGG